MTILILQKFINMLEQDFIKYEEAFELKVLGFDGICLTSYNPKQELVEVFATALEPESELENCYVTNTKIGDRFVAAPLWQQAFEWFRIEHGLYSTVFPKKSFPDNYVSGAEWVVSISGGNGIDLADDGVRNFKESENYRLKRLIEIVKEHINE